MSKCALITGVSGQDGSYLADFLLSKGYIVYGMVRRHSSPVFPNLEHLTQVKKFILVEGDMADQVSLNRLVRDTQPDEVYNLAAQSHVGTSFEQAEYTSNITGLGVLRMLEAIKMHKPDAKFYQASSSEMFGKVQETPQSETTPFYPRSPYGAAKAYGHYVTINYRESYGLFACSGILFNHESERRGINFITRKISDTVARVKLGLIDKVGFGTLTTKRDWGYAPDYVRAMWLMLQQDEPQDFVIGTGAKHSGEEFLEKAFSYVGLNWKDHTYTDPKYVRPAEVNCLVANASKAREILGWRPDVRFRELVQIMVDHDLEQYKGYID